MPSTPRFHPALKIFLFWALFLLLHYLYEFVPVFPLGLVSGVSEAFFQHQKVAFYTYLLVSLLEAAVYWRTIENQANSLYNRLLACVMTPWVIFLTWYFAAAVYGRLPSIPLEIIYANLAVLLTGLSVMTLEHNLDGVIYTRSTRLVILGLFLASVVLFIAFSHSLPWTDVFREPNWRP